jgi:Putative MetA-pathway of phenol degradation
MAGSQTFRPRGGRFAAVLALCVFSFTGRARAQDSLPPLPAPGLSAESSREIVDVVTTPEAETAPMTVPQPSYYPGVGVAPPGTRVELGLFDTITESVFGPADPDTWRPLSLSTFFSEGWNEAWVPSPNGSGGAPRQGWINAMDGNIYRLWFFTFAQAFNSVPKGNAYLGSYTLMTPLNRRLELIINVPFVLRNNAASGLPILNPNNAMATTKSHSGFGDMSFTPRFLLHETKDFSLTAELAVVTPTGNQPLAGNTTTLVPAFGMWNNFAGGWVIRGGLGLAIPMNGSGDNLISQLAIGNTFTDHDVPLFGDLTCYLSTVVNTPLANGDQTSVVLTPGMRTHLGRDWYFLAGLPIPLSKQRVGDIGMIFWFMKAW